LQREIASARGTWEDVKNARCGFQRLIGYNTPVSVFLIISSSQTARSLARREPGLEPVEWLRRKDISETRQKNKPQVREM
jgi:hypothetical protein